MSVASSRDWLCGLPKLFEPSSEADRTEATVAAIGLWLGYPGIAEAIVCSLDATAQEKHELRSLLNHAHFWATRHLMREAVRAGLNPAPLGEECRVCQELFNPILAPGRALSSCGVDWFCNSQFCEEIWPQCLGDWRYSLPQPMQEAIRSGEEVFHRLILGMEIPASVPPRLPGAAPVDGRSIAEEVMRASRDLKRKRSGLRGALVAMFATRDRIEHSEIFDCVGCAESGFSQLLSNTNKFLRENNYSFKLTDRCAEVLREPREKCGTDEELTPG